MRNTMRWMANFRRHCDQNLTADFQFCAGTIMTLRGGWFEGVKRWLARTIFGLRFRDETMQGHEDPRIVAVVAAVPAASIHDMASLAKPRVPLGLVTAVQDRWLVPRFHFGRVLASCTGCEHLADLPARGHGACLLPLPLVHAKVADFFVWHLLR